MYKCIRLDFGIGKKNQLILINLKYDFNIEDYNNTNIHYTG